MLIDLFQRKISYVRVSVTDRCDFRCTYCMSEDMEFLPKKDVLSLEELDRLCNTFIDLGVKKLRITGGEPLVRKNIMQLFNSLGSKLGKGLDELTLTTNGSQLDRYAPDLFKSGVRRINISLDSLDINKFKILIHPQSYVHAIIKFNNGLTKILIHDTDMRIPILNSIYDEKNFNSKSNKLNFDYLNNLNFNEVDTSKFSSIKILKLIPRKNSLYETVMVTANDELVHLFLDGKINFLDIVKKLSMIMKLREFNKYRYINPKNFDQIKSLSSYVRLKVNNLCI